MIIADCLVVPGSRLTIRSRSASTAADDDDVLLYSPFIIIGDEDSLTHPGCGGGKNI